MQQKRIKEQNLKEISAVLLLENGDILWGQGLGKKYQAIGDPFAKKMWEDFKKGDEG